jgi:hypothetical protein
MERGPKSKHEARASKGVKLSLSLESIDLGGAKVQVDASCREHGWCKHAGSHCAGRPRYRIRGVSHRSDDLFAAISRSGRRQASRSRGTTPQNSDESSYRNTLWRCPPGLKSATLKRVRVPTAYGYMERLCGERDAPDEDVMNLVARFLVFWELVN